MTCVTRGDYTYFLVEGRVYVNHNNEDCVHVHWIPVLNEDGVTVLRQATELPKGLNSDVRCF